MSDISKDLEIWTKRSVRMLLTNTYHSALCSPDKLRATGKKPAEHATQKVECQPVCRAGGFHSFDSCEISHAVPRRMKHESSSTLRGLDQENVVRLKARLVSPVLGFGAASETWTATYASVLTLQSTAPSVWSMQARHVSLLSD